MAGFGISEREGGEVTVVTRKSQVGGKKTFTRP